MVSCDEFKIQGSAVTVDAFSYTDTSVKVVWTTATVWANLATWSFEILVSGAQIVKAFDHHWFFTQTAVAGIIKEFGFGSALVVNTLSGGGGG